MERVDALCRALPEVTVHADHPRIGTRSTSYSYAVRGRSFCLLIAIQGAAGDAVPQLVLRAYPVDADALRSVGHPFHGSRAGPDRFRMVLAGGTDWEEVRRLVIESYRFQAPKKLRALVHE